MKSAILSRVLLCVLGLCLATDAVAERGRVRMQGGTVVTDQGTPLRGAFISIDWDVQTGLPAGTETNISNLSMVYGMNAVHLYAEKYDIPAGANSNKVDNIVNWAAAANVYVVITIGCGTNNNSFDLAQTTNFWKFYAPRYANRTHVIYEIHNEPMGVCNLSDITGVNQAKRDNLINMETLCYNIIRSAAPDTHIMFFSYSDIPHTQVIQDNINGLLTNGVSFTNASIAYHGYYTCVYARNGGVYPDNVEWPLLGAFVTNGYSFTCTEFDHNNTLEGDITQNGHLIKYYEQTRKVSWLCFFDINGGSFVLDGNFKTGIEADGVVWVPDFGTWPTNSLTPPLMSLVTSGGNVVIRWPTNAAGFILKSNADLTTPEGSWGTAGAGSVAGTNYEVTVPVGEGANFFRLVK